MNQLGLHRATIGSDAVNADVSVDNMSWWFWMKAGAGFTLGAGAVYVLWQLVWLFLIVKIPALLLLRWFKAI